MNDAYHNSDNMMSDGHHNWVDQQEREFKKRQELIQKFIDGNKRYIKEPLFRRVIDALVQDCDVWDIINKLVEMNKSQSDIIFKLLQQWPSHIPPTGIH